MRIDYAIVFVSDMDRSVAFYRDLVGLPLRFASPEWSEFATEGSILALHRAERIGAPETGPAPSGRCRSGFSVADLRAFHARAVAGGVCCLQEPKPLHGVDMAHYADPDGLLFTVSQQRGEG